MEVITLVFTKSWNSLRIQSQKVGEDSLSIGKHLNKCRGLGAVEIKLSKKVCARVATENSMEQTQLSSNIF